ncbi:MauE/DoxX family redox-associated membrane protein [Phenylobacterium sp.]|uniref:MauE/DoxX family redox-associated membrane protein n=1 Tax=Phenylobacterium sp. TaxID=1871053 RepID=UPI0025E4A526|nr:MauE/DoxX family redox-associated membrane protein [Phenylobacterium sp.]
MLSDLLHLSSASAAAFVALLLLRAALHKAGDGDGFEGVLADYGLVPEPILKPLRATLPGLEIAAAVALSASPLRVLGVGLAGGLLLAYGAAMAAALRQGRTEIDCGCGGPPTPLSWSLVARNLVLAAALVPAGLGLGEWQTLGETGVGWSMALIGLACWIACEHLAANHQRMRQAHGPSAANLFRGAT